MLYTAKKLTELKEKDHEVKESYLKIPNLYFPLW